jgi:hypothetical protein
MGRTSSEPDASCSGSRATGVGGRPIRPTTWSRGARAGRWTRSFQLATTTTTRGATANRRAPWCLSSTKVGRMCLDNLDPGIARAVHILRSGGVETCQSCEGGPGHSYPEATVRFFGSRAAGWHALSVADDYGLPVTKLRLTWNIDDGLPEDGAVWEMVFAEWLRNDLCPSSASTDRSGHDHPSPSPSCHGGFALRSDSCRRCERRTCPPERSSDTPVRGPLFILPLAIRRLIAPRLPRRSTHDR